MSANGRFAVFWLLPLAGVGAPGPLEPAFERMYNSDMAGAHRIVDGYVVQHPTDPFAYSVRATACLFGELDRLGVLAAEFFSSDRRILDKRRVKADPAVRTAFYQAIGEAERLGAAALRRNPDDRNALFALTLANGVLTDYAALIEKRHFASLSSARAAHNYALRLLALDPRFWDAYLTTGVSEYLLGSLPFFVRWFVKFDQARGSKEQARVNLEKARRGRYFGPFAEILLAVVHLREQRYPEARALLRSLAGRYPANPLLRTELAKLEARLSRRPAPPAPLE